MKHIILFFACVGLFTGCASLQAAMQANEPAVEPSGPIEIKAPASSVVSTTTTTTSNDGMGDNVSISVSADGQSAQIVENGQVVASASVSDGTVMASSGADASVTGSITLGGTSTTTTETTRTTVAPHFYCGMPIETHAALLNSVRSASPGDELDIVRSAASANNFTVDQAIAVLKLVNYHYSLSTKDTALAIYPVICDPGNWFKVYNNDVLDPLSVDEVKKAIAELPPPHPRF